MVGDDDGTRCISPTLGLSSMGTMSARVKRMCLVSSRALRDREIVASMDPETVGTLGMDDRATIVHSAG